MTSPPCRLEPTRHRGFDATVLDNGIVRATVLPTLGGKIASLVHLPSGREWLWQNPALPLETPRFDASYVEGFDTGGFDECFPSVAATRYPTGPWAGTPVPDHGELWALPWRAEAYCDGDHVELTTQVHGVRFPYRFERTLQLDAGSDTLRMRYRVHNPTPFDFPFIWSAHPIFAVTPGCRIVAPLKELTVYSAIGDRFGRLGTPQSWPLLRDAAGHSIDASVCPPVGDGYGVKLYGAAPKAGSLALQDPAGPELHFRFDPAEITHVGLWLNYGAWSGVPGAAPYYNLAIEPAIGAQDDLDLAVRHYREYGLVDAQGRRAWQLDLILR